MIEPRRGDRRGDDARLTEDRPDPAASVRRRRLAMGAAALVLSGLLTATAPFLVVGTITPPEGDRVITVASALNADSTAWRVGMALTTFAQLFLILGFAALYARLARSRVERWAFAGLVVTVTSLVLYLPMLGVVTYVLPAVGGLVASGDADAILVLDRTWTDPFIALPFLGGLCWHVGVAAMGVAVWRSGSLSRSAGLVLLLAGLLGVPSYFDVIALQYVSTTVLAAGLVLAGASLWRSERATGERATGRPQAV